MEINNKIIGQRIKDARIKKGLSQAALAEKIDRSVPFISHIETAITSPGLETLIRIANVLETTVNTLLSGNQINDPLEFHCELAKIMENCNSHEKRFIYELALTAKNYLRSYNRDF